MNETGGSGDMQVAKNIGALGFIRLMQFAVPFITVPYLARVIGVEGIGKVAFAQAVSGYFAILSELGIGLYAVPKISSAREDRHAVNGLLTNIFALKLIACVVSYSLFFVSLFFVGRFRQEKLIFVFASFSILPAALSPGWFFQGIEKMWKISFANLIGAIVSTACILIFVHKTGHYIFVPLIYSVVAFLPVVFMFLHIKKLGYKVFDLKLAELPVMLKIFKEAFPLFVSTISISIYTGIYTVALGFLSTDKIVGYYSAAERLIKTGLSLEGIVGQAFYPHISKFADLGRAAMFAEVRKAFKVMMCFAVVASSVAFFGADFIIGIIYGPEFSASVLPLKIMSLLFIVIGLSNIAGMQILLPLNKRKEVSYPVVAGGAVSLACLFLLVPAYMETGAAVSFLISEVVVTSWMIYNIFRSGIIKFS